MTARQTLSRFVRRLAYQVEVAASRRRMKRVDNGAIPHAPNEVRLFAKARNESLRLPWFLDYYFDLGVDRMFIVDNGSDDASVEIMLARPNVHVFSTTEQFPRYPNWLRLLLESYGKGHWCVVVDLDEMLIVPPPLPNSIAALTDFLERSNTEALRCLLLDMYPAGPIREYEYMPGQDPLRVAPFYDPDFADDDFSVINAATHRRFATRRYSGGMRTRVFGIDPNLTKVPVFRHGDGVWLGPGAHSIDGAEVSEIRSAVLHFKYLQDFVDRTIDGAAAGGYAGGSALLKPMAADLADRRVEHLDFEGSHRYRERHDLVTDGIVSWVGGDEGASA